jgi:hypothetical protein
MKDNPLDEEEDLFNLDSLRWHPPEPKSPFDGKPKFSVGMSFQRDGIRYYVKEGDRCEGDMIISFDLLSPKVTPKISHLLILADFKSQVEENSYGPNGKRKRGGQGAWYLFNRIKMAMLKGWLVAADLTDEEATKARLRRMGEL